MVCRVYFYFSLNMLFKKGWLLPGRIPRGGQVAMLEYAHTHKHSRRRPATNCGPRAL